MERRLTGDQLEELWGHPVWSRDGEVIGTLEDVFPEQGGNRPRWLGVAPSGCRRLVLVPLEGAFVATDGVAIAYTRAIVSEAPALGAPDLDDDTARRLDAYWMRVRATEWAAS
jgi:hypothetical protein